MEKSRPNSPSRHASVSFKGQKPKKKKVKFLYVRLYSTLIRQSTSYVKIDDDDEDEVESEFASVKEDRVIEFREPMMHAVMIILLRNKARLLSQAFQRWYVAVDVVHDYQEDLKKILSRPMQADELRTELEIEVMIKWSLQYRDKDPTSIAKVLGYCKSRTCITSCLQHLRLENILPGDPIVFQGSISRPEDGHFTIIAGECESVRFSEGSVPLLSLTACMASRDWEQCARILNKGDVMARFPCNSGFNELSSLTNTKQTSTIRATLKSSGCQLLVLPKRQLVELAEARDDDSESILSKVLDFFRSSGLANNASMEELRTAGMYSISLIPPITVKPLTIPNQTLKTLSNSHSHISIFAYLYSSTYEE